jgi:hypothetical protein
LALLHHRKGTTLSLAEHLQPKRKGIKADLLELGGGAVVDAVDAVVVTHHITSRYREPNNTTIAVPKCEFRGQYVRAITVFVSVDLNPQRSFKPATPSLVKVIMICNN